MWLGKDTVAGTVGSNAIDVVTERVTNTRHRRQFRRMWEQVAELVADRVEPLASSEFRDLPEHERLAAIDAVRDTLNVVTLTDADIYAQDLDTSFLNRYVRGQDHDRGMRAGLSADAAALDGVYVDIPAVASRMSFGSGPTSSPRMAAEVHPERWTGAYEGFRQPLGVIARSCRD